MKQLDKLELDKEGVSMKKLIALLFCLTLLLGGCNSGGYVNSLKLGELVDNGNYEQISNQIPQWVMNTEWNTPFYAATSSDITMFDAYAKENFPSFCDAQWTQEQSDAVYLGKGIEMFQLDNQRQINRIVYYPVILNGVIVSGYQVYERLGENEIGSKASPFLVNQLNSIMSLTNENTPLILGFRNDNVIGIVGDTYYVLDVDPMTHKEIELDKIPNISIDVCINVMEVLSNERNANVEDWVVVDQ